MEDTRMIFAIELKKCVASTGIFGVIIGKLYYEKKPYLIILLKVDKNLEVSFYYAILLFGLIVYLWVKDNEKSLLDTKEIA